MFLFHGSSLQNWHSILRLGLKNFSNTKYMSHGAAYGPGVYFSNNINVSSQYTKRYAIAACQTGTESKWRYSKTMDSNDTCVAICEIINQ